MRVLTEADFQAELEPILRQVFSTDDPFGQPFTANIPARRIIHEYFYQIESPLLEAIVDAASSIGDSGFYFSTLWRPKDEVTEEAYHWYIPFEEISTYVTGDDEGLGRSLILENVLYSPQGKWGVMMSHEHHGLLGGSQEFMEKVRQLVPNLDLQVFSFLKHWQYWKNEPGSIKADWMSGLLTHIYGEELAQIMLKVASLP